MRCCWCALLVICWLSALALELLFELLFMELLFALELLFIIRPHGAVEFLSCFVAEMLLFMELLCCKWCALLVICWLSARTGNSVLNGKIVSSQRTCTGNSVLNGKIVLESLR